MDAGGDIQKVMSMRRGDSGSFWRRGEDVFSRSSREEDDEEALRWAAIERLPTYSRVRTAILSSAADQFKEVDVRKLAVGDRQEFIERVFRVADEDNQRFLQKLRNRIDRYASYPSFIRCLPSFCSAVRQRMIT